MIDPIRKSLGFPCEGFDRLTRILEDLMVQYNSKPTIIDFPQIHLHRVDLPSDRTRFWIPSSYDLLLAIHVPKSVQFQVNFLYKEVTVECTCKDLNDNEFVRIVPFSPFLHVDSLTTYTITFTFCHPCTVFFEYMVVGSDVNRAIKSEPSVVCSEENPPKLFKIDDYHITESPVCVSLKTEQVVSVYDETDVVPVHQSKTTRTLENLDRTIELMRVEGHRILGDSLAAAMFSLFSRRYRGYDFLTNEW